MLDEYFKIFPKLKEDKKFEITSRQDYKYNCISWAALYTDRWLWPPGGYILDGVNFFWPNEIESDESIESFIKLFKKFGYSICEDDSIEKGYRKIALYADGQENCTHASRQKLSGLWTSKLGKEHDIEHGNPYSIEGDVYGKVYCIMKKYLVS